MSAIFSRLSDANRLNRIRKSITTYLELLARPKLERYISDCNNGIRHLQQNDLTQEDRKDGYDDMPMLTSEVLKSFPQNYLFIVSNNTETYSLILDFYYSIEFLRNSMPRNIYNEFSQWTNNHLENKNIPAGEDQFEHIKVCPAIARERQDSIRNIEMKISAANGLSENLINFAKLKWKG